MQRRLKRRRAEGGERRGGAMHNQELQAIDGAMVTQVQHSAADQGVSGSGAPGGRAGGRACGKLGALI